MRKQFDGDIHRPQYHFLPPANWMNDPNGVIQWNGKYHLFYQHNPDSPLWDNMHWGHAVSEDLVRWTDLPIALAPTPGSPDEAGCFSGSCADNDGVPTIFYTATSGERSEVQVQSLATSRDELITWEKYANNPVIAQVPPEAKQNRAFRDPFVWREDDGWYMVVGSRIEDVGGAVFLYHSQNLTDWEYVGPLLIDDDDKPSTIWECPNFFKLGDKWVLIISSHTGSMIDTVFYFVGNYENHRFVPHSNSVFDYGSLYAPLSFADDKNRRILFGWIREARSEVDQRHAGWSGVQSIPRVLMLDDQNRLTMSPVPELRSIRRKHLSLGPTELKGPKTLDIRGLALDIAAEFSVESLGHCGVSLACAQDDTEKLDIVYDAVSNRLSVHKVYLETNGATTTHTREVPHRLASGEVLKLRILLDGSVVEIIANERTSLTSRNYPQYATSNMVKVFGHQAKLKEISVWEMTSIW